jgi:ligand-binding SRPBCC domain-containing protein
MKPPPRQISTFESSIFIDAPVDDVFELCASADGFEAIFPHKLIWPSGKPEWHLGGQFEFRFRQLGVWVPWRGKFVEWVQGKKLVDVLEHGVMRFYEHTHLFEPQNGGTLYTDRIRFSMGLGGPMDRLVRCMMIRPTFARRHRNMKAILEQGTASSRRRPHA